MDLFRRKFTLGAAAGMALGIAPIARAQGTWPQRPVKLVCPLAPGGGTDVQARLFAEHFSRVWGQPWVVDSRPGANGLIGAAAVAKSSPDGYTLLITNSGFVQSLIMNPSPPFSIGELQPVAQINTIGAALGIDGAIPARTLAEFVDLAKANPGKYSFGSTGIGSYTHMVGELLNKAAGIDLLHVAFKGEAAAIPALLGGQISAVISSAGGMGQHVPSGKVRLLAIAGLKRSTGYPDVPTFAEAGYPSMNLVGWTGVFAPARTPADVVAKISDEIVKYASTPGMVAKQRELGYEDGAIGVAEFTPYMKKDYDTWVEAIRISGVKRE